MEITIGPHTKITDEALYAFYTHAVLPQFGIQGVTITWNGSQATGPDESAHYFTVDCVDYALIFEDFDGLGRNDAYIRENVIGHHSSYSFVQPIASSATPPSYDGFNLPTPYQYCENITGTFTLIQLVP